MNGTNYEVHHCGAFSTPHSHPSWAQIIRLRILFSNTLILHCYFNIRDQVSQAYSITANITVLYILTFKFLEVKKTTIAIVIAIVITIIIIIITIIIIHKLKLSGIKPPLRCNSL